MKKIIQIVALVSILVMCIAMPAWVNAAEWPYTSTTSNITGSGTANYLPKFLSGYTFGNSSVYDDGTDVVSAKNLAIGGTITCNGTLTAGATGVTGGLTTDNLTVTGVITNTSTSVVTNLNADLLDGYTASQLTSDNMTGVVEVLTFKIVGDNATDGKIYAGIKGDLEVPYACTISRATVLLDATDNMTVEIWKDTYANFPPTQADNITAAAPLTISATNKAQDSTLTGWTKDITAGDILRFYISSTENLASRCTISLRVTR